MSCPTATVLCWQGFKGCCFPPEKLGAGLILRKVGLPTREAPIVWPQASQFFCRIARDEREDRREIGNCLGFQNFPILGGSTFFGRPTN